MQLFYKHTGIYLNEKLEMYQIYSYKKDIADFIGKYVTHEQCPFSLIFKFDAEYTYKNKNTIGADISNAIAYFLNMIQVSTDKNNTPKSWFIRYNDMVTMQHNMPE